MAMIMTRRAKRQTARFGQSSTHVSTVLSIPDAAEGSSRSIRSEPMRDTHFTYFVTVGRKKRKRRKGAGSAVRVKPHSRSPRGPNRGKKRVRVDPYRSEERRVGKECR